MLYSSILDEGWPELYKNTEKNRNRMIQENIQTQKYISLEQTKGFNREEVQTEADDLDCWDIGGCNIYGGEQTGEFYPTGNDTGIKLFLNNIEFQGAIWVVNISQDIEQLWLSKKVLHDTVFSQEALRNIHLYIVYNDKPDTLKK